MYRRAFLLGAPAALAACAAEPMWAPDDEITRWRYRHNGPPAITLYTMISNDTDAGAHSGLLINAPAERVMFDPAGTFKFSEAPERNDVFFGVTERIRDYYERYHSRVTFRVLAQRVEVTPEVAQTVYERALAFGAVQKANCSRAVSTVLQDLTPFEGVGVTYFPKNLSRDFEKIPGVEERLIFETDEDNKALALKAYEAEAEFNAKQAGQ